MQILSDIDDLFDALGGNKGLMRITGASPQVVHNWKKRRRIPPERYLTIKKALPRGLRADPLLFGMEG